MEDLKIKLDDGAFMPARNKDDDTGYDLKALTVEFSERDFLNSYGDRVPCWIKVCTGVHIQPAEGSDLYAEVFPNSRISDKPFVLGNSVGVIDRGYTGDIMLKFKVLPWARLADIKQYFAPGKVVGQLVFRRRVDVSFTAVGELDATARGDGGFGSSENAVDTASPAV